MKSYTRQSDTDEYRALARPSSMDDWLESGRFSSCAEAEDALSTSRAVGHQTQIVRAHRMRAGGEVVVSRTRVPAPLVS